MSIFLSSLTSIESKFYSSVKFMNEYLFLLNLKYLKLSLDLKMNHLWRFHIFLLLRKYLLSFLDSFLLCFYCLVKNLVIYCQICSIVVAEYFESNWQFIFLKIPNTEIPNFFHEKYEIFWLLYKFIIKYEFLIVHIHVKFKYR